MLARFILTRLPRKRGRAQLELSADAESAIQAYPWPGNIRELRHFLERAVLLSDHSVLTRRDLPFNAQSVTESAANDSDLTLQELDRRHIERVLLAEGGNVERAAARLAIPRSSLYQKIKQHQISTSRF